MPGASLLKSLAWTQGIKFTAKPPSCFPFFFWTLAAWVEQGLLFSLGRWGGGCSFVLSFDEITFLLLLNLLTHGRITRTGSPCLIQPDSAHKSLFQQQFLTPTAKTRGKGCN